MHNCYKCEGSLASIDMKCYDNIDVKSSHLNNAVGNIPASSGIRYDGKNVNLIFCVKCGSIQGEFPIRYAMPAEEPEPPPVFVAEKLYEFWVQSQNGNLDYCHSLLTWLSVRISPTDCGALSDAFNEFLSVRHVHKSLPEYDELVANLINRYKEVKVH